MAEGLVEQHRKVSCVFKLGGSLLERHDWPDALRAWMRQQPAGVYLGIVGGGEIIEAMRRLDRLHGLSRTAMHWRCIRLLDATFEIAAELTPEFAKLSDWEACQKFCEQFWLQPGLAVEHHAAWVRIGCFYASSSKPGEAEFLDESAGFAAIGQSEFLSPREDWSTTSDTLCLLLAERVRATRCVLFKSCEVNGLSMKEAAARGIVDEESINFSEHVPKVELHRL